jgi:hypothetical protein
MVSLIAIASGKVLHVNAAMSLVGLDRPTAPSPATAPASSYQKNIEQSRQRRNVIASLGRFHFVSD